MLKYFKFIHFIFKKRFNLVNTNTVCHRIITRKIRDAPLAQLVEHLTLNQGVQGSSL